MNFRACSRCCLLGLIVIGLPARNSLLAQAQIPPEPATLSARPEALALDPFLSFELPDEWEAQFWADPAARKLLSMPLEEVARLVPVQAGLKHCRCPNCDASEADDTLEWSLIEPDIIRCRKCQATFPNDQIPAPINKIVPEEMIEVRPGVVHHYLFHTVPPEKQLYPEERLFLSAKRDSEMRESLSKAALYAAVRFHEQPPSVKDPALSQLAAVIILRFAQVYPLYATHHDQPGQPKFLQTADLAPPYRRGYQTAKWDDLGCHEVPLNLLIAYALLKENPAIQEAGRLLDDPNPRQTIENDLFRASAMFLRRQTEEFSESSLYVYRGLLAVGRLLPEPEFMHEAVHRLEKFAERGFYHDGYWRQGDPLEHRRILSLIDGWIDRLLLGYRDPVGFRSPVGRVFDGMRGASAVPQLTLARVAAESSLSPQVMPEIQQAAWPSPRPFQVTRVPLVLGGAGLTRLSVGAGADALDLEVRGLGDFDRPRSRRLTLRMAIGGQPVLGDLDDLPPQPDGFDRSTVSHNTVTIDGLNQRETLEQARFPTPGSDLRFHAADPDFQVLAIEDRYAYPKTATRYRQVVVACSGPRSRYAISVFDVAGGHRHDQFYHAAPGSSARWHTNLPTSQGPESLLDSPLVYLPSAPADSGRWFIQSIGDFKQLRQAVIQGPAVHTLQETGRPGVRLHLLGSVPAVALTAISRDPLLEPSASYSGRSSLIINRASDQKQVLRSLFVSVLEPLTSAIPELVRVGQAPSAPDTVLVLVQTVEGDEQIVVNLRPGSTMQLRLADGRDLTTDGLALRVRGKELVLAGGSFATIDGVTHEKSRLTGQVLEARRGLSGNACGVFRTDATMTDPESLTGRTLIIRHGEGTSRAWTVDRVINAEDGSGSWIYVREEPGFLVDSISGAASYYQFPRFKLAGPHQFVISQIARFELPDTQESTLASP